MKQKLAIVAHTINNRGGMDLHLSELIKRTRNDYNITVITTEFSNKYPDVKFIKIPIPKKPAILRSVLFTIIVSIILLFKKFDLVHSTGAIVLNRVDISTVHFCHRAYSIQGTGDRHKYSLSFAHKINTWLHANFAMMMEDICYKHKHIPCLVAVSEHVKKELLENFDYLDDEVVVIYNGVDTAIFKSIPEVEKRKLKNQIGIPEAAIVFAFIGGDWSRKGLRLLLDAFEGFIGKHPSVIARILVVGEGDKKVIQNGLSEKVKEKVIFQGFHEDPSIYYKMSDIFVLPSSYETFSIAALEAGACGLPVIMTKVGISDIVAEDNVTGYTVSRDKESIQNALEKIAMDELLRHRMSVEVLSRSEKITWDKTYDQFKVCYQKLTS